MYVIYTRGGIVVADSAAAIEAGLIRLEGSLVSGEVTAIAVEYANGAAKTYDCVNNLNDLKNITRDIEKGDAEGFARDATSVAAGTIAAEMVAIGIAAGVGGAQGHRTRKS